VIQTSARWLELFTAVGCMLKQVKAIRSERDHCHATGKRGTVAAIRRAHHCCPKHVAVETKASVNVGNRDAEVTYTNQLRTTNIAWHSEMMPLAVRPRTAFVAVSNYAPRIEAVVVACAVR
jgi:hypothetical protein